MRFSRRVALLSLGALAACRRGEGLLVFAAASTSDALSELGTLFEAKHGQRVRFSWGSSGDLARQIEAGAPADLFLSADRAKVDRLEARGHVASRRDLLRNRLVVVVPSASTLLISGPRDLARVKRLAIGDPVSVPAGAYAREWLENSGAWAEVSPHVVPTLDVRAALAAVESGSVDAAIVYRTDARIAKSAKVAFEPEQQPDIVYPLAVLTRARRDLSDSFVALATSVEGRAIFERRGFVVA
jgi:molybdate transport system substrate-binding protein